MKENKLLVITGASRGIGRGTAELFLEKGWQVVNLSRTPCSHSEVFNVQVDFAHPTWEHEVPQKLKAFLPVGKNRIVLVHNAFFFERDECMTVTRKNLEHSLQINLLAPMLLNTLLVPYMNKGSSIIYVGSTLSEKAVPGCFSYVAAKHAMIGMMRATCQDLMSQGIHTSCICPGFTETEMLLARADNNEQVLAQLTQNVFEQRLIKPSEIADCIFFAATNPVLNGSVIHANLGQKEF